MNRHILLLAMIGLVLIASLVGCSTPTVAQPTTASATTVPTAPRPAATSPSIPSPIPTAGTLTPLNTPSGDAIAVLTDVSGTVVNLKTFEIVLAQWGELGYADASLDGIYRSKSIPLQQRGVVNYTAIDKISEYHRVADAVTLVLVNGDRITGTPLTESSFAGDSALGRISLPAQKAKTIKFNLEQVKRSLQGKPAIVGSMDWPAKFTSRADVTLNFGDTITLRSIALVYKESGCSSMWIPCKPYTTWKLAQAIPIKYGEYSTQLDMSKIESMQVSVPTADTVGMNVGLRSGEKLNATFDNNGDHFGIAMLGATENGFIHVPLETIRSIVYGK